MIILQLCFNCQSKDCSSTPLIIYSSGHSVPQSVDWHEKNVVTPIKNQIHITRVIVT